MGTHGHGRPDRPFWDRYISLVMKDGIKPERAGLVQLRARSKKRLQRKLF